MIRLFFLLQYVLCIDAKLIVWTLRMRRLENMRLEAHRNLTLGFVVM